MGWSCAAAAAQTEKAFTDFCVKQTGSQNTYRAPSGTVFFMEPDRVEYEDGKITGEVYKTLPNDRCVLVGQYQIRADGSVKEWPVGLKEPFINSFRKQEAL